MRQLDNFVETLRRIGIDYKAMVLVDRVKENNSERTKGRLTFQRRFRGLKSPKRFHERTRCWPKFIFSLGDRCLETLKAEAEARGIKIRQLIRAIIIPDSIRQNLGQGLPPSSPSSGGNSPISQSPVGRLPPNANNVRSRRSTGESALQSSPTIKCA